MGEGGLTVEYLPYDVIAKTASSLADGKHAAQPFQSHKSRTLGSLHRLSTLGIGMRTARRVQLQYLLIANLLGFWTLDLVYMNEYL